MGGGEIWTLISDAVKIAPFWFVPKDTENPPTSGKKRNIKWNCNSTCKNANSTYGWFHSTYKKAMIYSKGDTI